jgi:hypothetical protein
MPTTAGPPPARQAWEERARRLSHTLWTHSAGVFGSAGACQNGSWSRTEEIWAPAFEIMRSELSGPNRNVAIDKYGPLGACLSAEKHRSSWSTLTLGALQASNCELWFHRLLHRKEFAASSGQCGENWRLLACAMRTSLSRMKLAPKPDGTLGALVGTPSENLGTYEHFIRLNIALPLYLYTKHSYWCYALLSNLRATPIVATVVPWELACVSVLRAIALLQMGAALSGPSCGLGWSPRFDLRAKLARSNSSLSRALPKPGTAEAEAFWTTHDARKAKLAYRIIAVDPRACGFSPDTLRYSCKPDSWAHSAWGCPQILESYVRELEASSRQCVLLITRLGGDNPDRFTHVGAVSAHPHEFEIVVPPCEYSFFGRTSDAPSLLCWDDLLVRVSELLQSNDRSEACFVDDETIVRSPLFGIFQQCSPPSIDSTAVAVDAVKDFCTHFWLDLWPPAFSHFTCSHPASVWGGSVKAIHVAFVSNVLPYGGFCVRRDSDVKLRLTTDTGNRDSDGSCDRLGGGSLPGTPRVGADTT